MAVPEIKDVERGEIVNKVEDLGNPLLKKVADEEESEINESYFMVLFSTFVAVCGSFEFGSCVGYSAPTQSSIRQDLNLSLAEAMRTSACFCITGWLAVFFSKSALLLDVGRTCSLHCFAIWLVLHTRVSSLAGLEKEFRVALQKLRGRDTDITNEAEEIQASIEALEILPKARIQDLVSKKYGRSVIIGVSLMVFQQFVGINGIGFYASETFVKAGLSSGKLGTIAIACVQVPITVLGTVLIDKCGRRPLIMISSGGIFLGCILTGTSFFLKGQSLLLEWVPFLAVGGVLIYIAAFSIGMGPVPWVIMSEIFPINVKGIAGSLVVLVNWSGAWAVSYTFNFLMSWSSPGTFYMYSAFAAMTIIFVAKMKTRASSGGDELKGGVEK
ncbi:hypothetical protein Bca101_011571 [Brassica carinata]